MAPGWVLPTVIGITFLVNLSTQLVNYKLVDQKALRERKKKMRELQKKLRSATNKSEMESINKQLLEINSQVMKQTMKPTLYTFVPMLIVFGLLSFYFKPYGDLIELPISLPFFGPAISWLGTYLIFSLIFNFTLRPLLSKVGERRAKARTQE